MERPLVALLLVMVLAACGTTASSSSATTSPLIAATATVTRTATPAAPASPTPTTAAADRFGYVFFTAGFNENSEQRIVVRREREAAPVFELAGIGPAVSADGKRLAYWRTTPNTGDANGPKTIPTDLRVLDIANPTSDRSVLTLSAQSLGGEVVWSNDGQGLLVVTHSRARTSGLESCPLESAFFMLDVTTTPPATRSAGSGACSLHPLAWDRPGRVAAAIANGPGGYATEYVTWNGNAASPFARTPVPNEPGEARARTLLIAGWVQASDDAKLVMALESSRNVLRVWPILDVTRAEYLRQPSTISPVWQPGATAPYQMIWGVGQKVELVSYPTATATTLYTSTGNASPAAVRPDGSGVLLTESRLAGATQPPPPSPTTATRLVFVDVATRQATDVASPLTIGVRVLSRGVLLR
jgi:hypothetical protein